MNPYQLLKIDLEATPEEIVRASVRALREKNASTRDIAEARKELMNPVSRRLLDFIYTVDIGPLLRDAQEGGASEHFLEQQDTFEKQV